MTFIVPAIIPQSIDDLLEKVGKVRGLAPFVQIDLLDGIFTNTKSWPYTLWEGDMGKLAQSLGELPFKDEIAYEADLMIQSPEVYLETLLSSPFQTLIFHLESTLEHEKLIAASKAGGRLVGFALKPSTPLEELEPWLPRLDLVQCMGSDEIGRQGVGLDERVYEKVATLRKHYPNLTLSVDIGVNFDTAPQLSEAGANHLVSGSVVFESDNIKETLEHYQKLIAA
jgi:ribulose-phosphate 3-epimerase